MKCSLCSERYNADYQSPVCPHGAVSLPASAGGYLLSTEISDALEEAYERRDEDTLRQYADNPNPLVRNLANTRLDALQMVVKLDQGLGDS